MNLTPQRGGVIGIRITRLMKYPQMKVFVEQQPFQAIAAGGFLYVIYN
jgi:hypothetical protein